MDNFKVNERLERIRRENAEFEKDSPYNFCDRWCARCAHEKQARCKLYLDEFERKTTCIAYGRPIDDFQVTSAIFEKQFEDLENLDSPYPPEFDDEFDDDFDDEEDYDDIEEDEPEFQEGLDNHPLQLTAEQYCQRAHNFLKNVFYGDQDVIIKFNYDFETIAWYHTLLAAKMHRALYGLHESNEGDEFGLCDAVAQLTICQKSIKESIKVLRRLKGYFPEHCSAITELLALLNNISSRIIHIEENI
ncbi:MAG: hypothetical protein ABIH08_00655 [Candidatus Omnitrophota bacterium]